MSTISFAASLCSIFHPCISNKILRNSSQDCICLWKIGLTPSLAGRIICFSGKITVLHVLTVMDRKHIVKTLI